MFGRRKNTDVVEELDFLRKDEKVLATDFVTEHVEVIDAPEPVVPQQDLKKEDESPVSNVNSFEADLTASISRNTTLKGDITTSDNIEIFGYIEGQLECEAVVKISGTVIGNIKCMTLVATGATIEGDITCASSIVIGKDTTLKGNVTTDSASIVGSINGNLKANGSTVIGSSAMVVGDITTSLLEVDKGATLIGSVIMQKPVVPEPVLAYVEVPVPVVEKTAPEKTPVEEVAPAVDATSTSNH